MTNTKRMLPRHGCDCLFCVNANRRESIDHAAHRLNISSEKEVERLRVLNADLLAALKAACNADCDRECEGHAPDCSFHDWELIARATIAKAEGEKI